MAVRPGGRFGLVAPVGHGVIKGVKSTPPECVSANTGRAHRLPAKACAYQKLAQIGPCGFAGDRFLDEQPTLVALYTDNVDGRGTPIDHDVATKLSQDLNHFRPADEILKLQTIGCRVVKQRWIGKGLDVPVIFTLDHAAWCDYPFGSVIGYHRVGLDPNTIRL